jgi:hypothetical protein
LADETRELRTLKSMGEGQSNNSYCIAEAAH